MRGVLRTSAASRSSSGFSASALAVGDDVVVRGGLLQGVHGVDVPQPHGLVGAVGVDVAAALVRPAGDGLVVVVVGEALGRLGGGGRGDCAGLGAHGAGAVDGGDGVAVGRARCEARVCVGGAGDRGAVD